MDICKWLENTVFPDKPPSLPEQLGLPQFLHPKEDIAGPSSSINKQRRKRKDTTSDSSFIEARTQGLQAFPLKNEIKTNDRAHGEASADESDHSDPSSSVSHASNHHYARRPRHKMRPERYDPQFEEVQERGKRKHKKQKDESRKTKRTSRRKKTDKPGTGLVQSFHASNVPKDRLTLKPREKLGIFNKGRASSPVRGRGLPDLVFSEMKFLQKRKDAPEEHPKSDPNKKRRKIDHAHGNKAEVSAYFTSMRPALAERDCNIQSKLNPSHQERNLVPEQEPKQQRSASIDSPIPTIELLEKQYLGFGSRGARHESASYLSWSGSNRQPSETPIFRRALASIDVGQLETACIKEYDANLKSNNVFQSLPDSQPERGEDAEDENDRFAIPPLRPLSRNVKQGNPVLRQRSPPKAAQKSSNGTPRETPEAERSFSSIAAAPIHVTRKQVRYQQPHVRSDNNSIGNGAGSKYSGSQDRSRSIERRSRRGIKAEPQTSSSLGNLLQECDSAFTQDVRWEASHRNSEAVPIGVSRFPDKEGEVSDRVKNDRDYLEASYGNHYSQQSHPLVLDGPMLCEEQLEEVGQYWQQYAGCCRGDHSTAWVNGNCDLVENYDDGLSHAPDERASIGHCVTDAADELAFMDANEQERRGDEEYAEDVLAGFWRPHKLY
ncbi:hypothetical protein K432DRAFT_358126 [Lepidopterella palustris CBS 459.81]|uniref:Uncharacterized protein n=1 Tax=Lepidopterella palustris CBS 459.81 TaxID=1314670 RepID=A0A8E2E5D1_9PEZI|nr:hypothetical protein K432DRAFT_358126 [Lepidopterella palustris CBS 459.81]